MYGELTLTLKTAIERDAAIEALSKMIGGNAVTVQSVVAGTSLASVAALALCAEQVSTRANIIYFMAGPDTLVAISSPSPLPKYVLSFLEYQGSCRRKDKS